MKMKFAEAAAVIASPNGQHAGCGSGPDGHLQGCRDGGLVRTIDHNFITALCLLDQLAVHAATQGGAKGLVGRSDQA